MIWAARLSHSENAVHKAEPGRPGATRGAAKLKIVHGDDRWHVAIEWNEVRLVIEIEDCFGRQLERVSRERREQCVSRSPSVPI